ncbi:MAG: YidC/Oxa1 family insertase periplasmic-domain containing protein [Opitutaceae bacterium]|nr:YidC/Oxa1 family insertase periplasmic-domain containing protein [Opitutaceae bacterium]
MDKKNTTIGVVLLLAAFALMYLAPKPPAPPAPPPAAPAPTADSAAPASAPAAAPGAAGTASSANTPAAATTLLATVHREAADARSASLENEFIKATFTEFGGAIRHVAFKKYPAVQGKEGDYIFNQVHEDPILALTDYPGLGRATRYELATATATEVVFKVVLDGNLEVSRRYRLMAEGEKGADPYRIRHETTLRNLSAGTLTLPRAALSLGTVGLVDSADVGQFLNVASSDGKDTTFIERSELEGGGFASLWGAGKPPVPVLERPATVQWAATKNQFFTSIYTADKPGIAVIARRIELPGFPGASHANIGFTGAVRFDLAALPAGGTGLLAGNLYVGPQEYRRLAKLGQNEDRVLPYTQYFFNTIFLSGYVAPLLNILLNMTHGWFGNWGVAVIVMTLILKIVSLPFTIAASKSAKRMSKIQPELQAIREKYKDNPQKQQQATMELFKTRKINPLGGCIPILITMPLFIGFFAMLQCPAELRFQSFLWAHDLAASDTVARVFGIPINIMPLLMGATMFIQMQLTPTPSVDNMQMKMMKFMPIIFTFFCYGFSCALSLYSTVNGLFSIGQQLVINRMKDAEETAAPVTIGPGGKPVKNVTPPKKK